AAEALGVHVAEQFVAEGADLLPGTVREGDGPPSWWGSADGPAGAPALPAQMSREEARNVSHWRMSGSCWELW
ncbi:hypothetical protein AB0L32_10695, partial [Micrococcus luteus]|uniref:hypothetical protein n=1 Tax=Micrococcus luteus TaxID=1270 RepID=UPI00343F0761